MKKDSAEHTSQNYDRKHAQNHIANNPRVTKDVQSKEDEYIEDEHIIDKRKEVRHEHTNHFTNRKGYGEKK